MKTRVDIINYKIYEVMLLCYSFSLVLEETGEWKVIKDTWLTPFPIQLWPPKAIPLHLNLLFSTLLH